MTGAPTSELVSIHVRAKAWQRDLIGRAACQQGRSRSDFMLEAACREAQRVSLDQSLVKMDSGAFGSFSKLLDKSLPPNGKLHQLLTIKAPWDQ